MVQVEWQYGRRPSSTSEGGRVHSSGVAHFVRFVLCTNPPLLGQGRPSAFFTFALKASHIGSDANALIVSHLCGCYNQFCQALICISRSRIDMCTDGVRESDRLNYRTVTIELPNGLAGCFYPLHSHRYWGDHH